MTAQTSLFPVTSRCGVKLPWYRMSVRELLDEARRALGMTRLMRDQVRVDLASGDRYAERQHQNTADREIHNALFYRDEWKKARRLGVVLQRKPSGLVLLRIQCGCEVWIRRLPDDHLDGVHVHRGRQARACGAHGICAARDGESLDARLTAAAIALVERPS